MSKSHSKRTETWNDSRFDIVSYKTIYSITRVEIMPIILTVQEVAVNMGLKLSPGKYTMAYVLMATGRYNPNLNRTKKPVGGR